MTLTAFNRAAIIAEMRDTFAPMEALLKPGDVFDYDKLFIGSVHLNGAEEHVVVVQLTEGSQSIVEAQSLGEYKLFSEIAPIPLFGLYPISPTDCFSGLVNETPYLCRALSWDQAEYVGVDGVCVKNPEISWTRPVGLIKPHIDMKGNIIIKGPSCSSISTNQN